MVTIESSKLFCHLKAEELQAVRAVAQERSYAAGEEIFKAEDEGDGVYVVTDGLVEISGLVRQDVRHVFAQVEPGGFFGEMAVLDNKPRSACATAVKATRACFIPRDRMLKLVEQSPALSLVLLRDITRRLREFDRQYIRELLRAERLAVVGRFARSIVHDLKNPLNIIGLTAEMVCMDSTTEEFRKTAMTRIRKQVERIGNLINDILEFTQGPSAAWVVAPMDYSVFVRQVADEIRPDVEVKGVQLELENQPPPARLLLNPKRLSRVFYNLAHNATDALPKGGKIILRFHANNNEIITEVEDTGSGIAPEIADRLFEPFATHGKVHGTGLGLSICKKIVEDHGGRIWARNEPGCGAVFAFALPLPK
jgi:signal transduction histidine kinase